MISVVMGVSAFDQYVKAAIDSIFLQTFSELEVIVVANGKFCDDIEQNILSSYVKESRLRVIKSQIGQLAFALNLGISCAKFDYIARMDSDDIALPDRLEKQLNFLVRNNLDMVGCNAQLIDENGKYVGKWLLKNGASINRLLPFMSVFCHPSVLIKKSILIDARGYNSGFNSEDYDLWLRLKRMNIAWDNMSDELLMYRVHSSSSQRRLLGYAECCGYALREFILNHSLINFGAVIFHLFKSFIRPKRR